MWPSLKDFSDKWRAAATSWRNERFHLEVLFCNHKFTFVFSLLLDYYKEVTTNVSYRKCPFFLVYDFPLKMTNSILMTVVLYSTCIWKEWNRVWLLLLFRCRYTITQILFPKHDCAEMQSDMTGYCALNTHFIKLIAKFQNLENSNIEVDLDAPCPPSL